MQPLTLQKELSQVSFLGIYRTTTLHIIFEQLHCYEITPLKKCNNPVLQKSETNIFEKKRYMKNLFKVNEKNKLCVLRRNQIMSKLLTLIKCKIATKLGSCLHCCTIF